MKRRIARVARLVEALHIVANHFRWRKRISLDSMWRKSLMHLINGALIVNCIRLSSTSRSFLAQFARSRLDCSFNSRIPSDIRIHRNLFRTQAPMAASMRFAYNQFPTDRTLALRNIRRPDSSESEKSNCKFYTGRDFLSTGSIVQSKLSIWKQRWREIELDWSAGFWQCLLFPE